MLTSLQEPGELHNNVANTKLTDELLAHDYFRRIAQFANSEYPPIPPSISR